MKKRYSDPLMFASRSILLTIPITNSQSGEITPDDDWDDEPVQEKPRRFTGAKPRPTRQELTTPSRSTPSRPATPSRPVSPTPPVAAANGDFTIHHAEELSVGAKVLHQRFGRGTVTNIDTSGDAKIDVMFNDGQNRRLLLKFAKFQIL